MTRRLSELGRVSSVALAVAMIAGPSPAAAQSFQGTGTFTNVADGSISTPDASTTNITVDAPQAVIDWVPFPDGGASGTAINFQPAGTTATFNGASDYAVLNRINVTDTSRIVAMSGTIQSFIGGDLTGGSIYFYSPSGFVIGSSAIINVGSLVLSASPITVGANGFITGTDNSVTFGAAPDPFGNTVNPNAQIYTNPGSQISALNEGSYVALVAPRVEHHGTINVNGVAALVGAEAATINFRAGGLFDIQVEVGTTDANGVVTDGTITGPASAAVGDYHRAYLVAVPKNDALTMLISSGADLGFDIAGAANVVGNAVVLSAGHDISFGGTAPSAASGADADLNIGNANFTSALYGSADGDAIASSVAGSLTFASDATLNARDLVKLEAGQEGIVTVGGNLLLSASASGSSDGESATAGNVTLQAFGGGTVGVTGNTDLRAVGQGGFSATPGLASGDGTGGTILVQSTSGSAMTLGGALEADASGKGGSFFDPDNLIDGGDGFGGTVNVFTSGGASMNVAGAAHLTANGTAGQGSDCSQCGALGGIGDAGTIRVQAHTGPNNTMTFGDVLYINANGQGGNGQTGNGGLGLGGDVTLSSADQSVVTVASDVSISAFGNGGQAFGGVGDGGDGFGGDTTVAGNTGGTLNIGDSFNLYLDGNGGSSESGNGGYGEGGFGQLYSNASTVAVGLYSSIQANGYGGSGLANGGEGQGGLAYYIADNGGTLTLGSFSSLSADGRGGDGFHADGLGGDGGLGDGGHVEAYANNATLDIQSTLVLSAEGEGGDAESGQDAGDSLGGDVYLQAIGGGTLSVAGGLYASAVGMGAYIGNLTNSGDGTGGFIGIYARDGDATLTVSGAANLNADGVANAEGDCFPCGGIGGIGHGGNIDISSQGAPGTIGNFLDLGSDLSASANGYGGGGVSGNGGNGIGGTVSLSAMGGNRVHVTGSTNLAATGNGGRDFGGFVAGNGTGGTAQITTDSAAGNLITLDSSVDLDASGNGGGSDSGGDGGSGLGGLARVFINGGTANFLSDLSLHSSATGGSASGGTGGAAQSGGSRVITVGGNIHVGADLTLESISSGGDGDTGGSALAFIGNNPRLTATSDARVVAGNGAISVDGFTVLDVHAIGGAGANGGSGGNASAGYATVHGLNRDAGAGSVTLVDLLIDAEATGGAGGLGTSGNTGGNGGNGGSATGGFVAVTASAGNGHLAIGDVTISTSAFGGEGGAGGNGDSGPGGNGGNGGAAQGGLINVGTESGEAEALGSNTGSASFASIVALASATGGNGGNSNFGSIEGAVGNGGNAVGGNSVLLVRGSSVNTGLVILDASATGGDSGLDLSQSFGGTGGNSTTGTIGVVDTNRNGLPAQRGTLVATAVIGSATATGGNGNVNGASLTQGGNQFLVVNSDATIGNLFFSIDALNLAGTFAPDSIAVINGDVTIFGGFDFQTSGQLSLFANNGSMHSDTLTLTASDFVFDTVNGPATNPGTYFANSAAITTGNNFLTDANLNINNDFSLVAPGSIAAGVVTTAGLIDLTGQSGFIDVQRIFADTSVTLLAGTFVDTGNIDAGAGVTITAQGGSMDIGNVNAGGEVSLTADSFINGDDVITTGGISAETASGDMGFDALQSGAGISLISGAAIALTDNAIAANDVSMNAVTSISGHNVDAGGDILASSGGDMTLADLTAGSDVLLDSGASMTLGSVTAQAGSVQASAVGVLSFADITAGTFVTIDPTLITGGDITALAGDVTATGDAIDIGNVSASDNVVLTALAGDLSTLAINAGIDVTLNATGNVTTGDIVAGGLIDATGASLNLGNLSANSIDLTTTVADLTVGNVTIPGNLALTTAGDLIFGDLNAFDVDLAATGSMTGGDIDSATDITAIAGTSMSLGDLLAGGNVSVTGGSLDLGDVTGNVLSLTSTLGDVSTGELVAFGSLNIDSAEDFLFGSIFAPLVDLAAPGSIIGGFIDSDTDIAAVAGIDIDVGNLTAGGFDGEVVQLGDIALTAGGDISTGLVSAEGSVSGSAGGSITMLDIDALDFVQLNAVGNIVTGDILAGDYINIFTDGGITTGDLTGTVIDLDAFGDVTFANVDADDFEFETDGDVTGGNIVATQHAGGDTAGAVVLGNISVGPGLPLNDDFSVGFAAGTSIDVGDVSGASRVGFATFGDLNTGNINAGDLFITMVGGDTNVGSITTTGTGNGRVYLADASMFDIGTAGGTIDFDYTLVVGLDPVPTGGSITVSGPVSTGRFQAAAGTGLTTQAITANSIEASAGSLASLNGMWSAPNVELWSNDIDIAAGAGIDAGNSGLIRLVSTNATQALIGDGISGTGYRLTNAEFSRLSGGNVQIGARGDASAAIDMLIGDLSITGPLAGSTIDDPNGSVTFATGDPDTQTAGGVIRITGDVIATGFTDTNSLEFFADRFELDAATGLLQITGNGTNLSGELLIEADRVHVASGNILDQLAANPQYAGYQDDLNAPAAVQRPDGVIRAGSIEVLSNGPLAVLVQNTGTTELPAGFLTFGEGPLLSDSEGVQGPIELIINGQLLTEGGLLTGVAVRDFLVDETNVGFFTANSTINGCLLAGPCGGEPESPFPPGFTPTPGIQDEITLFDNNLLPPPDFGNEDFIDDNDEETDEGETSPIVPPDPLFDTSQLGEADGAVGREVGTSMRSNPGLTETGDVDDPVSGGGNPSLMETPPPALPPVEEKRP